MTVCLAAQPGPLLRNMGLGGAFMSCAGSATAAGSLLFALDVEEESRACDAGALRERLEARLMQVSSLCRLVNSSHEELQLVVDVQRVLALLRAEAAPTTATDSGLDVKQMASRLSAMGYRVTVRNALGGGPACFRNLRHEFLTVLASGGGSSTHAAAAAELASQQQRAAAATYIVDPFFKQQFEVSQPSSAYAAALALVPEVFVGTSSRLVPLVHTLCAEMAASFEAMRLTLPPWRRASAMLSKWQPSRSRDTCISSTGGAMDDSASGGGSACNSVGNSPTAADAAAGSSPFSRLDDWQLIGRQNSGRSLLSGKLTSHNISAASSSSNHGASLGRTTSGCSTQSGVSGVSTSSVQQMQQQLAAARAAQVTRQPPVYRGQPATYTVKMGAALAPPPPQQQR